MIMAIERLVLDPCLVKTLDFFLSVFSLIMRSTNTTNHSLVRLSTVPFYRFDLLLDKKNPILYPDVFTNSFLSSF